jgi:murein DD-endopeptidase MepM/ murein hydrolase activator NlpD
MIRPYRVLSCFALGAIALITVLSTSAQAIQAQLSPTNPILGDTLSVIMQGNGSGESPSVTLNQTSYPAFPLGGDRYRALLPTTPLDSPGRLSIQAMSGSEVQDLAVSLGDRDFPTQRITLRGGGPDATDHELSRVDAFKRVVTPDKYWNGPFLRPNQGSVSSVYGVRRYYNGEFAENYYHRGVDYAAGVGSPVIAPAAGRITLVGYESDGFTLHGNTIGMDHGQGVGSIFIHLSRIDVEEGDVVEAGQTIGAVGATGAATGPHLHWGLYVHGKSVDPVPWREQGFE